MASHITNSSLLLFSNSTRLPHRCRTSGRPRTDAKNVYGGIAFSIAECWVVSIHLSIGHVSISSPSPINDLMRSISSAVQPTGVTPTPLGHRIHEPSMNRNPLSPSLIGPRYNAGQSRNSGASSSNITDADSSVDKAFANSSGRSRAITKRRPGNTFELSPTTDTSWANGDNESDCTRPVHTLSASSQSASTPNVRTESRLIHTSPALVTPTGKSSGTVSLLWANKTKVSSSTDCGNSIDRLDSCFHGASA